MQDAPKADLALRSSDDFTAMQGIRGSDVEAAVCRSRPPVDKLISVRLEIARRLRLIAIARATLMSLLEAAWQYL